MNIEELKNMLKNSTTVLVMDKGEPLFVIMDYKSYKNTLHDGNSQVFAGEKANLSHRDQNRENEILERLNKDILALKNQLEIEEGRNIGEGVD